MTDTTGHERARDAAELARAEVENLILRTPTSDKRNLYTEANILLMTAIEKLREANRLVHIPVMQFEDETNLCQIPPPGWTCTRRAGHDGPCAAWPT